MMQHAACVIAAHCIVCCSTLRWVVHCTAFVKRKSHLAGALGLAPIHRWLLFYPVIVWLTVSTWVKSLHLHLEVGDGAVELSGFTQGEYQCTLV